jgi:hypothetical protein
MLDSGEVKQIYVHGNRLTGSTRESGIQKQTQNIADNAYPRVEPGPPADWANIKFNCRRCAPYAIDIEYRLH